jgi:cytochrome c553
MVICGRNMFPWGWLAVCLLALRTLPAAEPDAKPAELPPAAGRSVDFVRDIEPILAARCNHCHGADEQEGQLRLDARAIVMRGGQSGPLLVPGKSSDSLLIHRVAGLGSEPRMPVDDEPLSAEEIGVLRAWIDQGAKWPAGVGSPATEVPKHWAYVAPRRPALPTVIDTAWPHSPIDRFVLARLEAEQLTPSPATDRAQLLRRVSLDLIGLPPTPDEVAVFNSDQRPDAYERQVDRLLASPHYGERWATPWLDAARYADSNGYQRDGHRTIWPYRDWVIRSLNADLPFDQFTIEQLAGDLLPAATLDQQIATGFHRCTTVNVEAGTDEEENRTSQVIDRVNVTGTVWLGTTLECCQCHNHKYDPFTQRDYYRLYAYFNSSPKETYQRSKGSAALDFGGPELAVPEPAELRRQREAFAAQRKQLEARLDECVDDPMDGLAAWIEEMNTAEQAALAKLPANIRRILKLAGDRRNANQRKQLRTYFIGLRPEMKQMQAEMAELDQQIAALAPPQTLVMTEMPEPRTTAILKRGNFLDAGEVVAPGTPRIITEPRAVELPANRLGLAQWLVDPANPLTARVQANRLWGQLFGRGIVASEEDLGTQCEPPTHPELLDWLAVELRDRSWSLKRLQRRIVQSATYQQSSKLRADLAARDPDNRLLARSSRLRLSAEQIRDNALAAAGLLSSKLYGPPVYPPQPEGVWRVTGLVDNTYRTSQGEDAWRRGLYTVQRRSAPYPSFTSFDAPDRSACTVKRPRTSTPLQALILQNDPVFVEAARALADRVILAEDATDSRLAFTFRAVLSREPTAAERGQLSTIFADARGRYEADGQAAQSLLGEHRLPEGVAASEWAAWFNVAHVLLNLDETITRN